MSLKDLLLLGALAWVAQSAAAAENYGFAYSTFGRAGLAETQQIVDAQRTLTFRLGAATFDKTIDLEAGARPIAFVPPTVTVRGLTLAFAGAIHPEALTLDVEDGRTLRLTAAAETAVKSLNRLRHPHPGQQSSGNRGENQRKNHVEPQGGKHQQQNDGQQNRIPQKRPIHTRTPLFAFFLMCHQFPDLSSPVDPVPENEKREGRNRSSRFSQLLPSAQGWSTSGTLAAGAA